MLIDSPRLRFGDREAWERASAADVAWSTTGRFRQRVEQAEVEVVHFARRGDCYAGVSWGKDSMVLADLCARLAPTVRLVWVRVEHHNPDCHAVRDAFLVRHPSANYYEHQLAGGRRKAAILPRLGAIVPGLGDRYLTGIRAEESPNREQYRRRFGTATVSFCAPLIHWQAEDVFAYLALYDLPVHPVYAMTFGGSLDRRWNRVSSLGGQKGRGTGRREWEEAYYPDLLVGRG